MTPTELTVCGSCRRLRGVRGLIGIVGAAAGLAVAGACAGPAAAAKPLPAQKQALRAVRTAVAAGWLDPATAASGRSEIARAAQLIRHLPSGRREHVAVALSEIAAFSGKIGRAHV